MLVIWGATRGLYIHEGKTARGNVEITRVRDALDRVPPGEEGLWRVADEEDRRGRALQDKACGFCGRPAHEGITLKQCKGCENVMYCAPGMTCQKADWPHHKTACRGRRTRPE